MATDVLTIFYRSTPFNQMSMMTTSDISRAAPTNKMIVSITASPGRRGNPLFRVVQDVFNRQWMLHEKIEAQD
ncbi:MAG: hypothetical protein K5821_15245 [Nitrobacter sp.]|nr:hypothetical protein [Nitrobacter sp.]